MASFKGSYYFCLTTYSPLVYNDIVPGSIWERRELMSNKKTHRTEAQKKALMNRLKRLEGQIRGLEKMIDEDAYCNDILQQSMSAGSAIDGFNQELLGYHLKGCVTDGIKNGDEEIVDELLKTMRKLMK